MGFPSRYNQNYRAIWLFKRPDKGPNMYTLDCYINDRSANIQKKWKEESQVFIHSIYS